MENLEEKIQEVLVTETNYNFALTADRRKIMSREPPNNLGMQGPGPVAYQWSGLQFRTKTKQDSWKTSQTIDDEFDKSDSSDGDTSESSDSDSESSDDDEEKNIER